MSINPFRENILVKRIDPVEKTAGGLYIPDPSKEKPSEGEVVAVGSGQVNQDGTTIAPTVKAGNKVIFAKWSGTEIKYQGNDLIIMKESDILAIVK
ncbi:MAG: co-chaperone GroES [Rickettsiales bacterium]|jgi:chaperonin GroES|nr:co-chaperone GroES [Rickettsiales bacterium]